MIGDACEVAVEQFFAVCFPSEKIPRSKERLKTLARERISKLGLSNSEIQLQSQFLAIMNESVLRETKFDLTYMPNIGSGYQLNASLVSSESKVKLREEKVTRTLQSQVPASVPHQDVRLITIFSYGDPYGLYSQSSQDNQNADTYTSQRKSKKRSRKREESNSAFPGPLTFDEIIDFAQDVMSSSHRTHFFEVWVGDKAARLFYFDRSGIIVSEQFTYTKDPDILIDFFWKFCHLSSSSQGFDTTLESASARVVERSQARTLLASWSKPQSQFLKIKVYVQALGTSIYTDYQESEDTEVSTDVRTFIATKECLARPGSVQGRGTWCHAAVLLPEGDATGDGIVYCLKEAWRIPGVTPEWKYLQKLKDSGVKNVPRLYCGGVTPGRRTVAHTVSNDLDEHVQQRLVTTPLGTTLDKFSSPKDLFLAAFDAVQAHHDAYKLAGILHRDVSVNNILIVSSRGCLSDWDMANDTAVNETPLGTWPFMSMRLCKGFAVRTELRDDLESVLWVLIHVILRYFPHNHTDQIQVFMDGILLSYGKDAFMQHSGIFHWVETLRFSDEAVHSFVGWMKLALYSVLAEDSSLLCRVEEEQNAANPFFYGTMREEDKTKIMPSLLSDYSNILFALRTIVSKCVTITSSSQRSTETESYKLNGARIVESYETPKSALPQPAKKARTIRSTGAAPPRRSGRLAAAEKRIVGGPG